MAIDPGAVGTTYGPTEGYWTSKDALLYALGVGCGNDDLEYVTENSADIEQKVLPTFACVALSQERVRSSVETTPWIQLVGSFDMAMLVHAGQEVELHRPLPVHCEFVERGRVTGIYDKGSAAVIAAESVATDKHTDEPLYTLRTSLFIRGEGGWGGDRGPSMSATVPSRKPDHQISVRTTPDQALLYRMSGDRNPLHSDPTFARRAGFPKPILHGLCTFGITGRSLTSALCADEPARFVSMAARFSKPVFPGDELTVSIWRGPDGRSAVFRTARGGDVVLDQGHCRFSAE